MGVLKLIGYFVFAMAVLTALAMGAMFVFALGVIGGILLKFIGATIFTAYALKNYFESDKTRSDLD